jgi:hypothetical protein
MAKNEYLLTPYKNGKAVGDTKYHRNGRVAALNEAKRMLTEAPSFVDEVDMQVIYDCDNPESDLSDIWWSIKLGDYTPPATHKRLFITKH